MSLPFNFAGAPGEELHRFFRNVCIECKKTIEATTDISQLDSQIDRLIDTGKQMDWHHKNSGKYHKDEGEKAIVKVLTEYQRYKKALEGRQNPANKQDLIAAISEVQRLIDSLKVT